MPARVTASSAGRRFLLCGRRDPLAARKFVSAAMGPPAPGLRVAWYLSPLLLVVPWSIPPPLNANTRRPLLSAAGRTTSAADAVCACSPSAHQVPAGRLWRTTFSGPSPSPRGQARVCFLRVHCVSTVKEPRSDSRSRPACNGHAADLSFAPLRPYNDPPKGHDRWIVLEHKPCQPMRLN